MIKHFYKSMVTSNLVEVEDFGIIDLDELPIRGHEDRKGKYEICWVLANVDGKNDHVLSECGGSSAFDFGGRNLGVIKVID